MSLLKFLKCRKGNVIALFAASLPVMVGMVGAAIDYSNAIKLRSQLANAVDAALLSVAKVELNGTDRDSRFNAELLANLGIDVGLYDFQSINLDETETINSVELEATVTADVTNMIMDTIGFDTLEMTVFSKAYESKTNVEVALVLDISSSMAGSKLQDLKDATKLFLDTAMYSEGEQNMRVTVSMIPYGGTVRLPAALENNITITGDPDHWEGGTWNGCLQYQSSDFDNDYISGDTFEAIPQHWKWNDGNWWCPKAPSVLIPQTTDVATLKAAVDNFQLSDGTGTDHGILWGYKMLSPDWKNKLNGTATDRPMAYGNDAIKIMLVMTDGGITAQFEPDDDLLEDEDEEPAYKTKNQKAYGKSSAQTNFHSVCQAAKGNGIVVYTVGVNVNKSWALQDLEDCATSTAHYFDVDQNQMESTFETIAASINTPRLTQ